MQGKKVLVLGGGDTAMDCVRSAVRQNADSVTCVYRKEKSAMPGSPREVQNAIEEGVEFIFNHQPTEILADNDLVTGVQFDVTTTDLAKSSDAVILEADIVIIAFGFSASPPAWFDDLGGKTNQNGLVKTDKNTLTSVSNIYAGGDMVSGADLVVTAIAQGREAARDILESFRI